MSRRSIGFSVDTTVDVTVPVEDLVKRLSDEDLDAVLAVMKARGATTSGDIIDLKQAEQLLEIRRCLADGHVRDATRRLDGLIHDLIDLANAPRLDSYGKADRHALFALVADLYAVT
jgi:hypothetical protein